MLTLPTGDDDPGFVFNRSVRRRDTLMTLL
jgi:hypothetical protein